MGIQKEFNLRALNPTIKTLELHHVAVKYDSFRSISFDGVLYPEETHMYFVLEGIPFHYFERNLVYPHSYQLHDIVPFPKISDSMELIKAIENYPGSGIKKYVRCIDNKDFYNIEKEIPLDENKILLNQDGEIYFIKANDVFVLMNDTMIYIQDTPDYTWVNLGNAYRSDGKDL